MLGEICYNLTMRIYGLDFTSAPSKRKPLTLACCTLAGDVLRLDALESMPSFSGLEAFLRSDGPWVCGMDFAFGQPRKLIDNLGFPKDWQAYVELVESMGKREWVGTVSRYMQVREAGDKLHFRPVDRLANAQSPMKMYFIPVGRMFYEGARRLAASGVSVLPNRPTDDDRVVLEVYPALLVREVVGRGSAYKHDDPSQQAAHAEQTRADILAGVREIAPARYGLGLDVPTALTQQLIADPSGDRLDALLCAVQAGWAQRTDGYGIPPDIDPLEGWIVDPQLREKYDV